MTRLDWDLARQHERQHQSQPRPKVIGSRQPVAPVHKHAWSEWESPPDTYATIERRCGTCGLTERGKLTRSEVAETPAERSRIRAQARRRRGYALRPEGDLKLLYKQRRQDAGDQRRD